MHMRNLRTLSVGDYVPGSGLFPDLTWGKAGATGLLSEGVPVLLE